MGIEPFRGTCDAPKEQKCAFLFFRPSFLMLKAQNQAFLCFRIRILFRSEVLEESFELFLDMFSGQGVVFAESASVVCDSVGL